jgi:hypothetical protein
MSEVCFTPQRGHRELRLQLINPSTSPNELNKTLMPHSIHPRRCLLRLLQQNLGHPQLASNVRLVPIVLQNYFARPSV